MSDAPVTRDGRAAALGADASSPAFAALVAAFQHVTIGMAVRSPDSRLIDVNPAYARMLGYEPDELVALDSAAIVHREASRLNRLVDDILLVDRVDSGRMSLKMTAVDLNALVLDVVATFRPLTDSHQFCLDLDPSLRTVDGDRDRLAQAITNLVSNAVKYSPAGGTVTIATDNDDDVVISVRDEGIGIAKEDLSRIFDRFERVETGIAGRIAGTGLGLSIAQEIASLHGRRLWADSELGLGPTFFLAIPGGGSEVRSREEDGETARRQGREETASC